MNTYNFEPAGLADLHQLVQAYVASLSSPIDSFLEEHILASQPYRILAGDGAIGYCAIHEQKLLTQFYIEPRYLARGSPTR